MAQIIDTDPNSNEHFFITGLSDNTLKAGKNSFAVNCTPKILGGQDLDVKAYDGNGNRLPVAKIQIGATRITSVDTRITYVVTALEDVSTGIGKLEISAKGIDTGNYTGSFAFYKGNAYPTTGAERLPLIQAPRGATAFDIVDVKWVRNILFDTSEKTDTEVRFFDFPSIEVRPRIYNSPAYPVAAYAMASGSCSGIAVFPKNNDDRNFYSAGKKPRYQMYFKSGDKFTSAMIGEKIRIKQPYIKNFTYADYSNNQLTFEGVLNTDFIAEIYDVINDTTLVLDIPFATVSQLVGRVNEDSPYRKNNLVRFNGYNVTDDLTKQTNYLKKNFYVLSIGDAEYEILYKDIDTSLPLAFVTGSITSKKSLLEIEFNNLRTYCGNVESYKIYGRSLNSPESTTLLASGRVIAEENVSTDNFNNGLYKDCGKFFDQSFTSRFWVTSSVTMTFSQSHARLIDGVNIGHSDNSDKSAYVIFKDDTDPSRTALYTNPAIQTSSYWYADPEVFINATTMPSQSYQTIGSIPSLTPYGNSQENLLSGPAHDSNSIKLRQSTLYRFSMRVKPSTGNTDASELFAYYVTNGVTKAIGRIGSNFKSITDEVYTATFFSDVTQFGTIALVPIAGYWDISEVSIKPYQENDYSIDSFEVKIPFATFAANELFEIEAELYDVNGKLAYGENSIGFRYNKMLTPLRKQFFVNPLGILATQAGGGDVVYDGGNAYTITFSDNLDGGG